MTSRKRSVGKPAKPRALRRPKAGAFRPRSGDVWYWPTTDQLVEVDSAGPTWILTTLERLSLSNGFEVSRGPCFEPHEWPAEAMYVGRLGTPSGRPKRSRR